MNDVERFYRDTLMELNKQPFHKFLPESYQKSFSAFNHYCGDELEIYLDVNDGKLSGFYQGEACAICNASTSAMMQIIEGKDASSVALLAQKALTFFSTDSIGFDETTLNCSENELSEHSDSTEESVAANESIEKDLANIHFLSPVKQFPVRLKCASLSWRALQKNI